MKQLIRCLLLFLSGNLILWPAAAEDPDFEEISVFVRVREIGGFDMNAVYEYNSGHIYLPVLQLFQSLRIKAEASPDQEQITGFLLSEEKTYTIDDSKNAIIYNNTTYSLEENDLISTPLGLFLRSQLFGKIFGLHATFHFRSLSVEIETDLQLPAIREMRLQQLRRNIRQLQGEVEVDTTLSRDYHLLRFGMLDWNVNSTQSTRHSDDTKVRLGIGAEVLGGETDLSLHYSTRYGFRENNQQYYWRWVNNRTKGIKQVRVGRVRPGMISSVYDPVIGVSVTNAPTTYRRSFGEYTMSDYTEPGWSVELYINNVLVDYQTADASGFYSFTVPMVYGSSQITLKFYGPYGEERTKEQFINIPFSFLPKGEMEYSASGGVVRGDSISRFGRIEAGYGVNRFFTLGGGMEYLSSIANRPEIPFIKASFTPVQRLIISGEYADGVRSRATLNYNLPSSLLFEIDYSWYAKGQEAIRFNYREERKASLSAPIRFSFLRGYSRWSFRQNVYPNLTHSTADMTFSTRVGPVNLNLAGYANWIDKKRPYIYSNISGGVRIANSMTIRSQGQIDITNKNLVFLKTELEKRFSQRGYVSLSAEKNFRSDFNSLNLNVRWDLPFAQSNFSARYSGNDLTATQGAGGSVAFGSGNGHVNVGNRTMTGRAGLSIAPFLDLNHNSIHDENEPRVNDLSINVNGGRILKDMKDSIVRVVNLEPYTSYIVELDDHALPQIAWRIKNKTLKVYTDPNQFKKIDIPVYPMGEVNGWVYLKDESGTRGQGRLLINFFRKDGTFVAKAMTESDGSYTFLGLPPGRLYAEPDSQQLALLDWVAEPSRISFEIKPVYDGDIVYDLNFTMHQVKAGSTQTDRNNLGKEPAVTSIPDSSSQKVEADTLSHEKKIQVADPLTPAPDLIEKETKTDTLATEMIRQKPAVTDLSSENNKDELIKRDMEATAAGPDRTVFYRVQLLALSRPLQDKDYFKKLLEDVPGLTIEELKGEDGLYRYSSPPQPGFRKARKLLQTIQKTGWKDGFISPEKTIAR